MLSRSCSVVTSLVMGLVIGLLQPDQPKGKGHQDSPKGKGQQEQPKGKEATRRPHSRPYQVNGRITAVNLEGRTLTLSVRPEDDQEPTDTPTPNPTPPVAEPEPQPQPQPVPPPTPPEQPIPAPTPDPGAPPTAPPVMQAAEPPLKGEVTVAIVAETKIRTSNNMSLSLAGIAVALAQPGREIHASVSFLESGATVAGARRGTATEVIVRGNLRPAPPGPSRRLH